MNRVVALVTAAFPRQSNARHVDPFRVLGPTRASFHVMAIPGVGELGHDCPHRRFIIDTER
jgi:hypothetical protein